MIFSNQGKILQLVARDPKTTRENKKTYRRVQLFEIFSKFSTNLCFDNNSKTNLGEFNYVHIAVTKSASRELRESSKCLSTCFWVGLLLV